MTIRVVFTDISTLSKSDWKIKFAGDISKSATNV